MANFNFNKVILGGRLTADPELKQTTSGIPVTTFSLAVNRKYGKDEERKTDFIRCRAWRTTAEFVSRYFKKGSSICVVGTLQEEKWTDKDGNKRSITEVVVEEASFVDSRSESGDASPNFTVPQDPSFVTVPEDDDLPF